MTGFFLIKKVFITVLFIKSKFKIKKGIVYQLAVNFEIVLLIDFFL